VSAVELPLNRRLHLVAQTYRASGVGWAPGWQTMRCECLHHCVFGVSGGWRGRGVAVYLYPRPGRRP
jgi:hypothetical protein